MSRPGRKARTGWAARAGSAVRRGPRTRRRGWTRRAARAGRWSGARRPGSGWPRCCPRTTYRGPPAGSTAAGWWARWTDRPARGAAPALGTRSRRVGDRRSWWGLHRNRRGEFRRLAGGSIRVATTASGADCAQGTQMTPKAGVKPIAAGSAPLPADGPVPGRAPRSQPGAPESAERQPGVSRAPAGGQPSASRESAERQPGVSRPGCGRTRPHPTGSLRGCWPCPRRTP